MDIARLHSTSEKCKRYLSSCGTGYYFLFVMKEYPYKFCHASRRPKRDLVQLWEVSHNYYIHFFNTLMDCLVVSLPPPPIDAAMRPILCGAWLVGAQLLCCGAARRPRAGGSYPRTGEWGRASRLVPSHNPIPAAGSGYVMDLHLSRELRSRLPGTLVA